MKSLIVCRLSDHLIESNQTQHTKFHETKPQLYWVSMSGFRARLGSQKRYTLQKIKSNGWTLYVCDPSTLNTIFTRILGFRAKLINSKNAVQPIKL